MMHTFLANNRDELIARCRAKVAQRPKRAALPAQLDSGVPIFLEQLERTLAAEERGEAEVSHGISGASGGDSLELSEIGVSAMAHGRMLLDLGYTIDQVVHDYGDLCQAITDMAVQRDAPFGVNEFRTLNRCLDNAIADATTGFSLQRDAERDTATNQRFGFLVHELRNALGTAQLAVSALEHGNLPLSGATGGVLKRSHAAMKDLVDSALNDARQKSSLSAQAPFSIQGFIEDSVVAADMYAKATGCALVVDMNSSGGTVFGNRDTLFAALANVLQNAFKFTQARTTIVLTVTSTSDRVSIDVKDHCGGLPAGDTESLFVPFAQRNRDRTGLGLGLAIAKESAEASGGGLTVRDLPGEGCVFTLSLPRYS